ncbi:MAG: PAS domain S-box protein, partial [Gemmatimonadetes bacterium]
MSPNHLEHDLVLLISTLSHLKNRDQIKSTFLDAINSFWDGVTFEFVPEVNHSETIIPLATAHHTFGGIQPSGTSETLSEPDMALLRNGCRMVALILENRLQAEMLAGEKSHLEAQVDQQAQYLQEVATQLEHEIEGRKVSEQRYRDIFENATVAIFIHDAQNGTILDANQKTLELFGYDSLEALQAHTVGELSAGYPPYSQAEALHHIEQAKLKGVQRFEWLAKHRDGTLFWVEVELKFIVIDGNEWVMAFSREIDSQKKAELALQQSQRRLQSILDTVHMIVVTLDRTGNITYTNDYFLNLTGWSREEVIGQNWFDLVIPSEIRTGLETNVFQKMLESGDFPRHYTNEILTKSGERRMIYWNNTAVYDESLRITGVTSLGQDITLQHTATQQLKGLTTRLSLAVESANIGIWDFNLLTNELIWDDRMFQLYGIEPTTYSKTHEAWQNSVHPQDLDRVEQEVQDAIDTTRRLDTEFRIVHPNGDIRYIRAYAQVLQNDAGEPVRLVGINYDITARKQTEEALWIRNFAIESAITPIGLAHLDGTIFYVNDAFRRL